MAALNFFRLPPGDEKPKQASDIAWYHTIELPDGTVTPGLFDHRALVPHYGIPDSLSGKRALDVATFDGFWAFELERRGAEVVALDLDRVSQLDLPGQAERQRRREQVDVAMGAGFEFAQSALGSRVARLAGSVYDLNPADFGSFDFVHVADLLLHLRSPIAALCALRSVTAGQLLLSDVFHPGLSSQSGELLVEYAGGWDDAVWWLPSLEALAQMVADAGFDKVRLHATYNLSRRGETAAYWRAVFKAQGGADPG